MFKDRRSGSAFVVAGVALLVAAGGMHAQESAEWPPDAHADRVYMIGQAHIDPVWLWPWYEGLSVVHSTFRSALDRMAETPGFAFTASSAQFYEWVSENDPAMLDEIRRRVEEGRWGAVGGWWVEPDVNLPSGESLLRQGLYGQLTFRRLLGRTAKTAFNPDSFGHPGTLSQILHLQGMDSYVFMRPSPKEKTLPGNLFWWEAPDGTRVLTYRIPVSYEDDKDVRGRIRAVLSEVKPLPRSFMVFYGAGDHGGGATKENIRSIAAVQKEAGAPEVFYSTPDRYFAEARKSEAAGLPVYRGDLQHHSVGCYTAESQMKKWNRTAEISLLSAEKLTAIGSLVWGAAYPRDEFTAAWKRVLFLQFHDSLAGTALPEHYATTAPQGYGFAGNIAAQALYKAAQKLAWEIPATDSDSQYLVVFNLQPWPVTENLEYDLRWNHGATGQVEDERGNEIAHQWTRPTTEVTDRQRLIARVALPPFGYRQIRIRKGEQTADAGLQCTDRTLENRYLRVTIASDGGIDLFDKTAGHEVFGSAEGGGRAIVLDDPSDTWSHGVRAYSKEIGAFAHASSVLIENGPVRGRVRVRSSYHDSTLTTDWILYDDARTLEARVTLDWHEHQKMLKFSFPVAVSEPRATYEIAYGNIVRDPNGDEEPGQRWIDVSGTHDGAPYGLSIANDAKYGYSVAGNDMRISIVRGAAYAHHQPQVLDPATDHLWQDQGVETFRMLLIPHAGTWQSVDVPRLTEEFTTPAPIVFQGIHAGTRAEVGSFLSVDAADVIVSAIKKSEEGDDLIVRCYEAEGRPVSASIDLFFAHKRWPVRFRPFEIKTLRFNPRTGAMREVNALEE